MASEPSRRRLGSGRRTPVAAAALVLVATFARTSLGAGREAVARPHPGPGGHTLRDRSARGHFSDPAAGSSRGATDGSGRERAAGGRAWGAPPPTPPCSNPGGRVVHRPDGSTYPYFGWKCAGKGHDSDCGQCFTDHTCKCIQINASTACCETNGTPPPPPAPPSPPPWVPPYAGACAVSSTRPECKCGDEHPPFDAPSWGPELAAYRDYHFPESEGAERAGLSFPALVSVGAGDATATLRNAATGATATVGVGGASAWGWSLLHAASGPSGSTAVVEFDFAEWGVTAFLTAGATEPNATVRMPVGRLESISQPRYGLAQLATDPQFFCKQDVDPTDWLAKAASAASGGEEATVQSAVALMAPNRDSGLLGNPEEFNKWVLTGDGELLATPWGGPGPQGSGGDGCMSVWRMADLPGCGQPAIGPGSAFDESKMGMAGESTDLRVVTLGLYRGGSNASSPPCGVKIVAVSPPAVDGASTSVALLRVTINYTAAENFAAPPAVNTTYIQATVLANGTKVVSVNDLGQKGAPLFYAALASNQARWASFAASGAVPSIPGADRRYAATALSTLTLYMNLDQGLTPEYGGGQFWNTYNINLPLDTLALGGALLEWGHAADALRYIGWFLSSRIDNITGTIDYRNFGCDSDADYGRMIDLFATAVRYSCNTAWAAGLLPTVHAMAGRIMTQRAAAVAAFPAGSPLHGIAPGSPEHDICHDPGHFFSLNVWHVRGLLSLHELHEAFPSLACNATLEAALLPTANAWRDDIHFAANFTAVRKSDGSGELFFLSPVVGSVYSMPTSPQLLPGGTEDDCVERGTCFASMTAALPGGGSNQHTNYANFRIFSETLLAPGVLDPEYEAAIMNYRESHRGTLLGMTRFRDLLDDMPILGYGKAALRHGRPESFHAALAGHSLNYLSRGAYWGAEQRQQLDYAVGNRTGISNGRWRNDCGVGGEYCSLCVVSAIPTSYWTRWMLVSEDREGGFVHVAPGAPRRWARQASPVGVADAPTWFGEVTFQMRFTREGATGTVALRPWNVTGAPMPPTPLVTVRIPSPRAGAPATAVSASGGAKLVSWNMGNETAVFSLGPEPAFQFSFSASF